MFIKDTDGKDVKNLLKIIRKATKKHKDDGFVAFVFFLDGKKSRLRRLNKRLKLDNIALCLIPPGERAETLKEYKINPNAQSTILVYKSRVIKDVIVNYDKRDSKRLLREIAKVSN